MKTDEEIAAKQTDQALSDLIVARCKMFQKRIKGKHPDILVQIEARMLFELMLALYGAELFTGMREIIMGKMETLYRLKSVRPQGKDAVDIPEDDTHED